MIYHFFIITKFEIISLFLNMGLLIRNKISFKCSHFTLVKEWTVWTTPQIQEIVNRIVTLLWRRILLESSTNLHTCMVH